MTDEPEQNPTSVPASTASPASQAGASSTLRQRTVPATAPSPAVANTATRPGRSPSSPKSSGSPVWTAVKFVVLVAAVAASLSFLVTGNFLFGYHAKLPHWRRFLPKKDLVLTEKELARYDGTDTEKPIYLAISGVVYDVTAGRDKYGPKGGYKFFAGRDAARAFVTGCFDTHLTHDLRGLTAEQIKEVDNWMSFYDDSDKYFRVGRVLHPPIDPDSPIPSPCKQ